MKIIVSIDIPWFSGIAWHMLCTLNALKHSGHEVYAAGDSRSRSLEHADELGVPVQRFNGLRMKNPALIPGQILKWNRYLNTVSPDVLITYSSAAHWLTAMCGARRRKIRIIRARCDARKPRRTVSNHILLKRFTCGHIFSATELQSANTSGFRLNEKNSIVLPGYVDTSRFKPTGSAEAIRKEFNLYREPLVGIVGRLDPVKDHPTFLRIADVVCEQLPEARFLICGKEANTTIADLTPLARQLDIEDKVIFAGHREDIPEILNAIDIGMITSNGSEKTCRTAMEFAACAKPLITTDTGCLPDLIRHKVTGLLFKPGNVKDGADHLLDLLNNPDKQVEFGAAARKRVENRFSLEPYSLLLEKFIKRITCP